MKILILTINTKGGMIHYVSQLANALAKDNEVVIIAPKGVDQTTFSKDIRLIELHLGNIIKNFIINTLVISRPLKFIRVILSENPDVVHIQEPSLWWSFFLPFLSKFPLVFTIHDVHPHVGRRKWDQIIGQKFVVHYANEIIVHGESAKKEFLKKYKIAQDNCHVIPHGDYSFFLDYAKEVTIEKQTILFFGYIEDYKGLDYLINAIHIVSEKCHDVKLIIAGQGDLSKYKSSINANAHLFEIHNEYIPDQKVPKFFQRASLVVLPYIEGTQTGVVPIAYAFKKPVIVTNVGSIHEVVDNGITGLIVQSKDADSLAVAILNLLQNDDMRKIMGINAYKKMHEELSWDLVRKKTLDVYVRAIERLKI